MKFCNFQCHNFKIKKISLGLFRIFNEIETLIEYNIFLNYVIKITDFWIDFMNFSNFEYQDVDNKM
jgi:hypothetical protein